MFSVQPNPACRGETVYITYGAAEGSPVLETSPAVPGLSYDPRNRNGVVNIVAENDLVVTFTAKGSESSQTQSSNLIVRDPATPVAIAPGGQCPGVWRQTVPVDQWPSVAQVVTVTNLEPVPITVTHLGNSVTLGPAGSPSDSTADFGGQPLTGDWNLSRTLSPGECPLTCGLAGPKCPPLPPLRASIAWRCVAR
jgi:hypothetical protein